jgi:DNA-binding MarR family transcriptional regulator
MKEQCELYQRFINLALAAEEMEAFPALTLVESRILSLLSTYWSKRQPITVVESINMAPEISTSTVFRHLKTLRRKGYVDVIIDTEDNRVKFLTPTHLTNRYFAMMGKLMMKAMK